MPDRRKAIAVICALPLVLAVAGEASARPFDRAAFEAALGSGQPVIVHVTAPWCPICRAQHPILERLMTEPRFGGFQLFEIDFDNDKASVRAVGARLQSTLILYKGGKEIARTVGDREQGWIEDLLEKALPPAGAQARP